MNIAEFKNIYSAKLKTVSPTPLLELDILISFALGKDNSFVYKNPEYEFSKEEFEKLIELINRRSNFEPIAYIVGYKEFYGNKFFVDPRVLIPRPETEKMVDLAYERLLEICNSYECINKIGEYRNNDKKNKENNCSNCKCKNQICRNCNCNDCSSSLNKFDCDGCGNLNCCASNNANENEDTNCPDCDNCNCGSNSNNINNKCEINIADIGTGSGCIIISLAKLYIDNIDKFGNCPVNFYATDISGGALEVAILNALEILGAKYKSLINFKSGSLLEPLTDINLDIITANLPYIPTTEIRTLQKDVKNFEPMLALDGGEDGFELIDELKKQINKHNKSENKPFVILEIQNGEINYSQ